MRRVLANNPRSSTSDKEVLIGLIAKQLEPEELTKYRAIFEYSWATLKEESGTGEVIGNAKFLLEFHKQRSPCIRSSNRDVRYIFKFLVEEVDESIKTFEASDRLGLHVDERKYNVFQVWCIFLTALFFS